jgi:hypothetical protein
MKLFKRASLAVLVLAIGWIVAVHLIPRYHQTPPIEPPDVANDVARLNRTVACEVIQATNEDAIRNAVLRAAASRAKVTIAGKRHSMGGDKRFTRMPSLSTCCHSAKFCPSMKQTTFS